jgi:hypothetical protein
MEYQTIVGFNGINRQVSPFLIELGEMLDTSNLVTEKVGVFEKSFDYTIKGAQITASQNVLGGFDFYRNDGTHDHFVAVDGAANADIYFYTGGAWSAQSQSLTAAYKVRFAYSPTIDTLFSFNYADATRSWNGLSWSTTTNVTDAPKAYYGIGWGDRIYLLNCEESGTAYPSRLYRSEAIETSVVWDPANDYIVFDDAGTGVGTNGENLFVACQNSTHIFTLNDDKYKISDIGCVSHEGIVSYGGYTFYPSRDGYYAHDGRETFKISAPIEEYWDKIPEANYDDIQAVVNKEHVYVYIGDVEAPWDSSVTLQNVIFDYNILQNNWNKGNLGNDSTHLHIYVTSSGKRVFFGDDDGQVYEMFDGSGQQNAADYSSHLETNWVYGSGAGVQDDFYEVHAYGKYLSGLKVSYKTSEEDSWRDIGELTGENDTLRFKKRSDKIKFRMSEYSGKNLYEIYRIDVGYEPAYEMDENRTR